MSARLSGLILALLLSVTVLPDRARAADRLVEVYGGIFIPAAFSIEVGDAVIWVWREGNHRLVLLDGQSNPVLEAPLDAEHPQVSRFFEAPGDFSFSFDQVGVVGSITVVPFAVKVEVVDIAFTPEEVSLFEGDAIDWVWIEGDHTITSGRPGDPNAGLYFDVPSTFAQQRFTYAFTEIGLFDYFCRPHVPMRMFGQVRVQQRFIRGDLSGDGAVNISDPVLTISSLFLGARARPCPDSGDANDDGKVDVSDAVQLLEHLFLGGASISPPYPRQGADRTEDGLECW